VDYKHPEVGPQEVEMTVDRESFSRELAPARTFGFMKDFAGLQAMGLIRGGSVDNAIVLDDDSILNGPLRFADEFGRHKALDLIGDLALVGRPLKARIVAHKAGHALHTQLVTRLLADRSLWTESPATHVSAVSRPALSDRLPLLPERLLLASERQEGAHTGRKTTK
jgi:UDP-3-O-[3-hydroxymyristoyl] N-acetylglucosamine deacetylase